MSQHSFRALGVSPAVADALAARSIEQPFKIQCLALPDALAGLDVLAKSPTGSGKTLVFAIPIVERTGASNRQPSALVLVPTRELAVQVTEEHRDDRTGEGPPRRLGLRGSSPRAPGGRGAKGARPGRNPRPARGSGPAKDGGPLGDSLSSSSTRPTGCSTSGFKPQVDRIVRRIPKNRQTMFFSATLDGEVGKLAGLYTSSPSRFEADAPLETTAGETEHRYVAVSPHSKVETLVEHLSGWDGLTLVFVRTKRGADRLTEKLARHGMKAEAMHGDLSQRARAAGARAVRVRQGARPCRDRRGGPRPRHRRDRARDQLRSTRGGQGVPPPHGAHRPRRPERAGDHIRAPRSADRYEAEPPAG